MMEFYWREKWNAKALEMESSNEMMGLKWLPMSMAAPLFFFSVTITIPFSDHILENGIEIPFIFENVSTNFLKHFPENTGTAK